MTKPDISPEAVEKAAAMCKMHGLHGTSELLRTLLTELREALEVAERRRRMFRRNVRLRLEAQRAVPAARDAGFEACREMVVSHLSREKEAAKEMGFPEAAVILAGVSREISALQPQKEES